MSDVLETYQALKRTAESKQREADRAAGALAQSMKRLETEFGVKTLAAAQDELTSLTTERDAVTLRFKKELASLQKKWNSVLND